MAESEHPSDVECKRSLIRPADNSINNDGFEKIISPFANTCKHLVHVHHRKLILLENEFVIFKSGIPTTLTLLRVQFFTIKIRPEQLLYKLALAPQVATLEEVFNVGWL